MTRREEYLNRFNAWFGGKEASEPSTTVGVELSSSLQATFMISRDLFKLHGSGWRVHLSVEDAEKLMAFLKGLLEEEK